MTTPAQFPQQCRRSFRPGLFVPGLAQGAMAPDGDGPLFPDGCKGAGRLCESESLNKPVTSTSFPEAINSRIPSC